MDYGEFIILIVLADSEALRWNLLDAGDVTEAIMSTAPPSGTCAEITIGC